MRLLNISQNVMKTITPTLFQRIVLTAGSGLVAISGNYKRNHFDLKLTNQI